MALELVPLSWVETCRLRGGIIIIRSRFYVTGGGKPERLIFSFFFSHQACRKRLAKKSYWVVLCHIVWVGRCQPLEVRNTETVFCAKQTPIICFIYQFKNTKSISHIKLSNCLECSQCVICMSPLRKWSPSTFLIVWNRAG